jgi:N,N-dimethylformamidase
VPDQINTDSDAAAEVPITGYLDRFSHRPGKIFSARVSARDGGDCRARLVRVVSADPNPAGPGMRLEDKSAIFDHHFPGRRQPIRLGSYAIVETAPVHDGAITWTVLIWTASPRRAGTVIAHADGAASLVLSVGAEGAAARLTWPGGSFFRATGIAPRARTWTRLTLAADPRSGRVELRQEALDGGARRGVDGDAPGLRLPTGGTVMFAARNPAAPSTHFTGKLEAPKVFPGFCPDAGTENTPIAAWDFSIGIDTQTITDTGPHACHGRLINMPQRAVVGAHWSGREQCWRHAPEDYGAIHFHDGDLADCGWDIDFSFKVPDDLPSGAYALHLTCAAGEDFLPLYVLPKRNGPFAPIAFLAATFTYQAYANHARGNADAAYKTRVAAWGAAPHNPDDFPIYGRSTYNKHEDGAGIAFSSRLRPILTMRPGFLTFDDPRGSGLRHYPADTHLLAWLDGKQIPFDIITDEDLDDEGISLLAPYRAVLTSTHPEYHTPGTLDALQAYIGRGGRLACLGGNGFYWRIARHPENPGVIELRRAEGGIRAWAAEPGEYYHQFDGGLGGLWRRNRRPPQMLTGIGFTGQGRFEGTYFRRTPASSDERFAWMFDGITDEIIGDYGLSGGGAAGFELDRSDPTLGTPEGTVVLARAENLPASFVTVPEELLSHLSTVTGENPDEVRKGEIVYFDTPSGGAVFSAGSITFCGSLWREGAFDGPVSRLLENVVRRFSA